MKSPLIARAVLAAAAATAVACACPASRAAGPSTTRADMQEVRATITELKGLVSVRDSEDAPFRPAAVGAVLPMGAEFRTGPRSSVTLSLPANQTVTIDRLGLVKLLEAYKGDARFHTDVGMKYGRVRYEVEAGGLQHESVIRSPSSALAVRGTVVEVTDDAFGSRIRLVRGDAQAKTPHAVVGLKRNEDATGEGVQITDADTSLAGSLYGDAATPYSDSAGLSSGESEVFAFNNAANGTSTRVTDDIHDFAGGSPFFNFNRPIGPPPPDTGLGKLVFQLQWEGEGSSSKRGAPDLDLFVLSPTGKFFEPGKAAAIDGNVKVGKNDRGGGAPNKEKIQWLQECPPGTYSYGVKYTGSGDPGTFTVNVTLNGKRISAPFQDTLTEFDPEADFTIAVPPASNTKPAKSAGTRTAPARAAVSKPVGKPSIPPTKVVRR